MNTRMPQEEPDDVAVRLREYAASQYPSRRPANVVLRGVVSEPTQRFRFPWLVGIAAAAMLVGAIGLANIPATSDEARGLEDLTVTVDGKEYLTSIVRGLRIPSERLTKVGDAEGGRSPWTEDAAVYRVEGVPPSEILVMRAVEGARDDVGPIGDYVVLVERGTSDLTPLCTFVELPSRALVPGCGNSE